MQQYPYMDIIKQLMIEQNLSQQKLSDILGVNQTTVSQWLMGKKKPNFESIIAIYENFSITHNELFGIDN